MLTERCTDKIILQLKGYNGISNAFGSALWALDFMFNIANVGVDGVNFHGNGQSAYNAVSYNSSSNVPIVHPLYYAIYAMAQTISTGTTSQTFVVMLLCLFNLLLVINRLEDSPIQDGSVYQ